MRSDDLLDAASAYRLLASGHAPDGLQVSGVLDYSRKSRRALPQAWPARMHAEVLDFTGQDIEQVPSGLSVYELILAETPVTALPDDVQVETRLDLSGCARLESLPPGLTVGTLVLRGCTALTALPEALDVWFLDLSGCWAFEHWPRKARIHSGILQLRGCTALRKLPRYLERVSAINVRDCPNLTALPSRLEVSGWLDLAHSGLTTEAALPPGLARTQLRWTGVNIDRRIAFHPETLATDEILSERNSERRRVLLDRYGYGRFLQDAEAEVLDHDRDPGGERQLLRIKLPEDEDLVAMSCCCPSTGRQYIIRVPPQTPTCRHAAAWIAGFDDPEQYQPLVET
jgi:hypothetical protein